VKNINQFMHNLLYLTRYGHLVGLRYNFEHLLFFNDFALDDRLGFNGRVVPLPLAPAEFDLLLKIDRFIFAVPDSL